MLRVLEVEVETARKFRATAYPGHINPTTSCTVVRLRGRRVLIPRWCYVPVGVYKIDIPGAEEEYAVFRCVYLEVLL